MKPSPLFKYPTKNFNITPDFRSSETDFHVRSLGSTASSVLSMSSISSNTTQVENTQKTKNHFLCVRNSRFSPNIFVCRCRDRFQVFRNDSFQAKHIMLIFMHLRTTSRVKIHFDLHNNLTHSFNKWQITRWQPSVKWQFTID